MPLPTLAAILAALIACVFAAVCQARLGRVPNALTLGSLTLACAYGGILSVFGGGPGGLLPALCGALIGGMLLVPFYAAASLGAGCVKMQMAFGAWIGCAMGLVATALVVAVSTVVGIAVTFAMFTAVVRLFPAVEYDVATWQMNAQSTLSLGSVVGLVGWLYYGAM